MLRDFRVECVACSTIFYTNKVDKLTCSKECRTALIDWRQRRKRQKEKVKIEKVKIIKPPSKASLRPDYLKWKARKAVELALRYGKITRPDQCPLCLENKKTEAHHHNYSKPLEIEWICRKCHLAIHKKHKIVPPTVGGGVKLIGWLSIQYYQSKTEQKQYTLPSSTSLLNPSHTKKVPIPSKRGGSGLLEPFKLLYTRLKGFWTIH